MMQGGFWLQVEITIPRRLSCLYVCAVVSTDCRLTTSCRFVVAGGWVASVSVRGGFSVDVEKTSVRGGVWGTALLAFCVVVRFNGFLGQFGQ